MRVSAIVTAAGSAERFGGRKLLADVDAQPLLQRTIASLLDGGIDEVVVVLGPEADELLRGVPAFADRRVRTVVNADASRGMLSSIQAGATLVRADAIAVLPGDMPFVRSGTVAALLEAYGRANAIVSPRYRGKRGHPVILPGALREELLATDVTKTLHDVIRAHAATRVDLDVDDRGVVRDVDVVGDLAE